MNQKNNGVPTRSAPETRFELAPAPGAPFRATQETELEPLKERLLVRILREIPEPAFNAPIRRAANDAAALAWTTAHPTLVFPVLLEEMAATARLQVQRQARIRERSRELTQKSPRSQG